MEILNQTVYNSEDIAALFKAVVDLEDPNLALPKKLAVGYYTPTPKGKLVPAGTRRRSNPNRPSPFSCINLKGDRYSAWRGRTRLGIVRPLKLHRSPLEQLASVVPDEMVLPQHVIRELVIAFLLWAGRSFYYARDDNHQFNPKLAKLDDCDELLKFKVRYTLRAGKETREERQRAKKVADEQRIDALESKIRASKRWEHDLLAKLSAERESRDKLVARYRKLCKRYGKYHYY